MKKDELMQVIEILKKYDLMGTFNSIEEAEKFLLTLDSKRMENLKKLYYHKTSSKKVFLSEILSSCLRKILLNDKLLASNFYEQALSIFLKLEQSDTLDEVLCKLCDKFDVTEKLLHDIELVGEANVIYLSSLLMDDNFINSPYREEDLSLFHSCVEYLEAFLVKVATNPLSIQSKYHSLDMRVISEYPDFRALSLSMLACNQVSLSSSTHEDDMDVLTNCPFETINYLFELMTTEYIVKSPNYDIEKKYIRCSNSEKSAEVMLNFIQRIEQKDQKLDKEKLECLLAGIDSMPDIVLERILLHLTDEFINSPHMEEDIELIKQVSTNPTIISYCFFRFCELLANNDFRESEYFTKDIECISSETKEGRLSILLDVALNKDSLNSITHRFDMNFIKKVDLNNLSDKLFGMMMYYLLDPRGIYAIEHVDALTKIYQGIGIDTVSPIEEYFKSLISNVQSEEDGKDINMLIKK